MTEFKSQSKSKCKIAQLCGGCAYAGKQYSETLAIKKRDVVREIGKLVRVSDVVPMDNPYHYRNKVNSAIARVGGQNIFGTYVEGTHRVLDNSECFIEDSGAQEIIKTVKELAGTFKIPIYDERARKGVLRRVLVRVAKATNEIMVVLVAGNREFPRKKDFIKVLRQKHPEIVTVILNVNNRSDSMILGDRSVVEYGKGYITDELLGLKFRISDKSFYQVNHAQTEKLYSLVNEFVGLGDGENGFSEGFKVLDAYCGTGTIGMMIASKNLSSQVMVTGVEINKTAVSDAKVNALINGLTNYKVINADATEYMLRNCGRSKYDVVILDPPRSGTTAEFVDAVIAVGPSRVVYVSCNPVTLGRDLKLFVDRGYDVIKAVPVDMFPWTGHVETVVMMTRVKQIKRVKTP